jgi:hypothetical protein
MSKVVFFSCLAVPNMCGNVTLMNAHHAKGARLPGPIPAQLLLAAVSVLSVTSVVDSLLMKRQNRGGRGFNGLIQGGSPEADRFDTVKNPFWRVCSHPIIGLNRSKSALLGVNQGMEYCFDKYSA